MKQFLVRFILVLVLISSARPAGGDTGSAAPLASPALAQRTLDSLAGSNWQMLRGEDFVIYHRGRIDTAQACSALLDHTRRVFIQSFAEAGLFVPDQRPTLEWIVFSNRLAFDQYARVADQADASWMQGYYSARTNRVALVIGGDSLGRVGQTGALHPHAHEHDLLAGPLQMDLDLASVTHEAAHQLAFNLGLQRRGVTYPLWISEGLATNFEALWWNAPLGPAAANPYRRDQLRAAAAEGRLLDLAELITLVNPPTRDPEAIDAIYAQSWALFRFLLQDRPLALRAYLDTLSAEPHRRSRPGRLREIFHLTLGHPSELDAAWEAHLAHELADPLIDDPSLLHFAVDR